MNDLRTAAQQALEALGLWATGRDMDAVSLNDLIFRLEGALAQPQRDPVDEYRKGFIAGQIDMRDREQAEPEQEPVAWMTHGNDLLPLFHKTEAGALAWSAEPLPLYTIPPQRKQDAEWRELDGAAGPLFKRVLRKFARAIEREISRREKND